MPHQHQSPTQRKQSDAPPYSASSWQLLPLAPHVICLDVVADGMITGEKEGAMREGIVLDSLQAGRRGRAVGGRVPAVSNMRHGVQTQSGDFTSSAPLLIEK